MVGGKLLLLPEILGQSDPVGAKTLIFNRYSLPCLSCNTLRKKFD